MIWYNNYDAVIARRDRLAEDWQGKQRTGRRSRGLRLVNNDRALER